MTAIIESQVFDRKSTKECRITTLGEFENSSLDLTVTASPFHFNNLRLTLLSIVDVSHQKRRQVFERIFFHDVMNTITALKWNLEYLPLAKSGKDSAKVIKTASVLSEELIEEIIAQRDLAAAEAGDLESKPTLVNSGDILAQVISKMEHHSVSNQKKISVSGKSVEIEFKTDIVLLKRVLTNMLKNALEATAENEHVTIGSISEPGKIIFWTKNPAVMPHDVRLQIFQRSFSTKGQNRGLGTYSMKLITEKYLDGKIGFVSNETEGTMFYIELPV
jgi:signal transduction histidine kinase